MPTSLTKPKGHILRKPKPRWKRLSENTNLGRDVIADRTGRKVNGHLTDATKRRIIEVAGWTKPAHTGWNWTYTYARIAEIFEVSEFTVMYLAKEHRKAVRAKRAARILAEFHAGTSRKAICKVHNIGSTTLSRIVNTDTGLHPNLRIHEDDEQ